LIAQTYPTSELASSKNSYALHTGKTFMNIKPRLITLLSACMLAASASALTGSADPAIAGATHIPQTVAIGQISVLHTDFVNAGWDPIPAHSVSVSICGAASYYRSNSMTPPAGYGTNFTWTHLGTSLNTDCWVGTNNVVIAPGTGGPITLNYTGVLASPTPQTTLVYMEVIANPASFTNENRGNNDATATLAVTSATPAKPPRNDRAPRGGGQQWR